jgi:WD40 repeat protein
MNGYVASCASDTAVNIWNPNTGESIRIYTEHSSSVNSLDQIDADTMVSGSWDNTIHIWKISTGERLYIVPLSASFSSVKSLSNGLIACGSENNINIYEYSTGNLIQTLIGHSNSVNSIEVLNEQFMASGSSDTEVIIWDLTSYSIKYNLSHHENIVKCVKRLSSNLMASTDLSGLIIIWDWMNGSLEHRLTGHIMSPDVDSYDDQTLISGSWDKIIKFWNITNGQLIKTINSNKTISTLVMLNRGR